MKSFFLTLNKDALPVEGGVRPAGCLGDQSQQDHVVDQDQSDREQETPKHGLVEVKVFVLVQSRQPAAVTIVNVKTIRGSKQ